mgnify:FL=1
MPDYMGEVLKEYAELIKEIYKSALKAVILYGSYARGDYTEDSDVDILILVDMAEDEIGKSRERLSSLTYDFNEVHDLKIMPEVIGEKQFAYWLPVYPFYQNIEKDGVSIYAA